MIAVQAGGASWVHQDPVTKSQRVTDSLGSVISAIDLDPWGGETSRSSNQTFQPHRYTTYERDANGGDDAMRRRYQSYWNRFSQPDPASSYDPTDPQSFNRYAYTQNDPVNFTDPSGLYSGCIHKAMTNFLAKLTGRYTDKQVADLTRYASSDKGGADSFKYSAINPINIVKGFFGRGPSARIHFANLATLSNEISSFPGYIAAGNDKAAGFVVHSAEDVGGAHQGFGLPFGHVFNSLEHALFGGKDVDHTIGDPKFTNAANGVFQLLTGDGNASLTPEQMKDLISAVVAACGAKNVKVASSGPTGGGGGGGGGGEGFGGYPGWWYSMGSFLDWVDSIEVGSGGYGEVVGYQLEVVTVTVREVDEE